MIKANVPSRIAFAVSSQTDSRVILDQNGAESLLGQGDMLFSPVGTSRLQRIQGAYIDEPQIEAITDFWRKQGEPEFREELLEEVEDEAAEGGAGDDDFDPDEDPLLEEAIHLVAEMGTASTSMLQRRLRLGYTRAGRLIDMLERRGVISGYEGSKPRQVLVAEADVRASSSAARARTRPCRARRRVLSSLLGAMPDIGATLREARMRHRIDITEMEARTKIRAKYLRALENEEWDLLPGPTYVKTFLRTYADALGLDARMLVEEYKLRHERLETGDLQPIRRPSASATAAAPRRGGARVLRARPGAACAAAVVARCTRSVATAGRPPLSRAAPGDHADDASTTRRQRRRRDARPSRSRSGCGITPTAAGLGVLVRPRTRRRGQGPLTAGRPSRGPFRSQRFRITLGNGQVRLRVNGRPREPPEPTAPRLRDHPTGLRELQRRPAPTCGA